MALEQTVFLRFEDWSIFTFILDRKGIPHGGKIIKVYPSLEDPRELYGTRKDIAIVQIKGGGFTPGETFEYPNRGTWTGHDLDNFLHVQSLPPKAIVASRALFRFSNIPELWFCQTVMQLQSSSNGRYLIAHPMGGIDSFNLARKSSKDWDRVHLDIFEPKSLAKLFKYLKDLVGHDNPVLEYWEVKELNRVRKSRG